jgi:hypothetical protein
MYLKLWYCEVHEVRRLVITLRAASEEEAREQALELARRNELDVDTLDREAVVVRHPAEGRWQCGGFDAHA